MPYFYVIEDEGETEQAFHLGFGSPSIEEVEREVEEGFRTNLYNQVKKGFADKGYDVDVVLIMSVEVWHTEEEHHVYPINTVKFYRVHYRYKVKIRSAKKIMESPIAIEILVILKWIIKAIVLVIIAWFVAQAIKEWLQSMTTKKTRIIAYDPETGEIIEEEYIEEPSIGGIGIVGIFILILFVIALFWMVGSPKGQK